MKEGNRKLALGAVVGILAGFLTGILTAPKSGRETREDIKVAASKVFRQAEKNLKALQAELKPMVEKALKLAAKKGVKTKRGFNAALSQAQDAQQKIKQTITAIKSGETDEPELKAAIKEITKAKNHLAKYLTK